SESTPTTSWPTLASVTHVMSPTCPVPRTPTFTSSPPEQPDAGAEQDLHVLPERPVLDVIVVEHQAFLDRALAPIPPQAVDLRPSGDPGGHAVAGPVLGEPPAEQVHEVPVLWPGPDQGHVAPKDVEELGQLVQAGAAEEPSHPGHRGLVGPKLDPGLVRHR